MAGGVFCIENWSEKIASPDTVLPLLEFLRRSGGGRYIHQPIQTKHELAHYLSRFSDLDSYQVGYLQFHGDPGKVYVGAQKISLEQLSGWSELGRAPQVEDARGRPQEWVLDLRGKVLYLGSCATLRISQKRLEAFRKETGAVAVCGYTRRVYWFESAGFDVILLSALADAMDKKQHTARRAIERLRRDAGDLMDRLGFVCEPRWDVSKK